MTEYRMPPCSTCRAPYEAHLDGQCPAYQTAGGQRDAFGRFGLLVLIVIAALVIAALLRWAYTTWYIDTHCTYVLGTRVCQ